ASKQARLRVIREQSAVINKYWMQERNWIGMVLHSMSKIMETDLDDSIPIQYREQVMEKFNNCINDKEAVDQAKIDPDFSATLSFAKMLGASIDLMNGSAVEENNALSHSVRHPPVFLYLDRRLIASIKPSEFSIGPMLTDTSNSDMGRGRARGRKRVASERKRKDGGRITADPLITATPYSYSEDRGRTRGCRSVAPAKWMMEASADPSTSTSRKVTFADTPSNNTTGTLKLANTPKDNKNTVDGYWKDGVWETVDSTEDKEMVTGPSTIERDRVAGGGDKRRFSGSSTIDVSMGGESADEDGISLMNETNDSLLMLDECGLEAAMANLSTDENEEYEVPTKIDEWTGPAVSQEATCFKCEEVCANYKKLARHLYNKHRGVSTNIFQCLGCLKKYRSMSGALGHVKIAKRKKETQC
ncbi:hypothetical protein PENTCL1PPCAC_27104, partial [Pristionchus entomophagus]